MINALLPENISPIQQARAKIIVTTCIAISAAMLALILFWIATHTLEDVETIYVSVALMLVLAGIVALTKRGHIKIGAWLLTGLIILLNLANMADYGIATTSSAGYIIAILLAIFSIGTAAGFGVTILGCISVFAIAWLASNGQLQTQIPFTESTLSFDAPALTLIFLLTAALASGCVKSTSDAFNKA